MASDLFDLTGRVALITGGGRGIGKACAKELAKAGANVVVASRTEKELQAVVKEVNALGVGKAEYIVADMTDRSQVRELARRTADVFGKVDILFNNAGTNVPQPCDSITDEVWDKLIELNFSSCMALTRAVVPGMKERKWGRIIYTASIMATVGNPDRAAYCGTKAGLVGMAHSQATELGPYNITVNCISPGPVATELPMSVLSDEQKKVFAGRTALGRWGEPEEMAGAVLLLASNAGSYITGADFVVDGGCTIKCF
jgi:NAD(P)-dependent dehydrogenase (short-subunit alcohol dehydrogenase family)